MRYLLIFFFGLMFLQCQTSKKDPMQGTDFYISEYTIMYKSKELPFGKPVDSDLIDDVWDKSSLDLHWVVLESSITWIINQFF